MVVWKKKFWKDWNKQAHQSGNHNYHHPQQLSQLADPQWPDPGLKNGIGVGNSSSNLPLNAYKWGRASTTTTTTAVSIINAYVMCPHPSACLTVVKLSHRYDRLQPEKPHRHPDVPACLPPCTTRQVKGESNVSTVRCHVLLCKYCTLEYGNQFEISKVLWWFLSLSLFHFASLICSFPSFSLFTFLLSDVGFLPWKFRLLSQQKASCNSHATQPTVFAGFFFLNEMFP